MLLCLSKSKPTGRPGDVYECAPRGGFVLLGGPLEGTSEVLLIIRTKDAHEIPVRLWSDPWTSR